MNATPNDAPAHSGRLADDSKTLRRLQTNYTKNKEQDHTPIIDAGAKAFRYEDCADAWWNAPEQSLLWGTALWDGATERQRILLNQLYWVAYYSQVVSAEVATIFFNQTSAAGLYGLEDFRLVCDTLDLETSQERAHIAAFRRVSDEVEQALFGKRLFTWDMRGPFEPTMIYSDLTPFQRRLRTFQLKALGLISADSAFMASQYLTIRGLRTLNGKMVQSLLSRFHVTSKAKDQQPIPSKISHWHYMDESFHFNSSTIIGLDVVRSVPKPTMFERFLADEAVKGVQRDHKNVSVTVRGLFWDDTAAFQAIYTMLRSREFAFDDRGAREMLRRCFTEDSEAMQAAHAMHATARESYARFIEPLPWMSKINRDMSIMAETNLPATLERHRAALRRFTPGAA